jgi:L-asparagine transporter-like permease
MTAVESADPIQRESGLRRVLTTGQLAMIGIGGAIGTGLFMGSGIAIAYAGPAVILSYAIAGFIALIVMFSLSEMTVAHPTAGSFGTYADLYWNAWSGYVVRFTYCAAQIVAMGGEAVAIGHYVNFWYPELPIACGAGAAGLIVTALNCRKVADFGAVEFTLSSIKVIAILLFILFGIANIFGLGAPALGLDNYFVHGGPLPHGLSGVWMAVLMAIFSFVGIEMIAVAAGESADPNHAVPKALHSMMFRLALFYGLGLGIMLAVVPWDQSGAKIVTESPFVLVFANFGLPFAANIMNMVVILAALSSMNTLLYLSARMLFSLSRTGRAPELLGRLSPSGTPIPAALCAALVGSGATAIAMISPAAYNYLLGIALFGAIWTWCTILITHVLYRRTHRPGQALLTQAPWQLIGLTLLVAVLITMALDLEFWNIAILVGLPWIIGLTLIFNGTKARIGVEA